MLTAAHSCVLTFAALFLKALRVGGRKGSTEATSKWLEFREFLPEPASRSRTFEIGNCYLSDLMSRVTLKRDLRDFKSLFDSGTVVADIIALFGLSFFGYRLRMAVRLITFFLRNRFSKF